MENRNPWLDVCRSAAIGMVMLSHGRTFVLPIFPTLTALKFGGFLGVELFFVLSGFLIGSIMIHQVQQTLRPFTWVPRFWIRRWFRTIPNYVLFLLINLALIDNVRVAPWPNLIAYATFTQNLIGPIPRFFVESWSLSVEEIFYLVTPLAVSTALALIGKRHLAIPLSAIAILTFSTIARLFFVIHLDDSFADVRSTVVCRLDAIMVGVLMAWVHARRAWQQRLRRTARWGAPFIFIVAIVAALPDPLLDASRMLKIFLFPAASLACAAVIYIGISSNVPRHVDIICSKLARWSYSAYLANVPVILTIRYFWPTPSELGCWIGLFSYVVGTFTVAAVVYSSFEKRMLYLRDTFASSRLLV